MSHDFSSRLTARILVEDFPPAVVGLDPRLDALPDAVAPGASPAQRIVAFYESVLPRLARHVAAVKPNIAFFERYGAEGYAAYETTCRRARALGLLVIGDVKRGDIGTTAEAYADGHARIADAVTLHPMLGTDSLAPFLDESRRSGLGLFVLVRTSNASAAEFQDLATPEGTLSEVLATAVDRWGRDLGPADGYSTVGAVVGATWPEQLVRLRRRMPRAWLLLPGVGAQGARVADVLPAFDASGLGALVTQSRAVMQTFARAEDRYADSIEHAAAAFAAEVRAVVAQARAR